jgi:hypothetical protein
MRLGYSSQLLLVRSSELLDDAAHRRCRENRNFRSAHADPRNAQAKPHLFVPKLRRLPIQARLIGALQLLKYHIFRAMAPPESPVLIEK